MVTTRPLVFHDLGYHSLADMVHFLTREHSARSSVTDALRAGRSLLFHALGTAVLTCVLFSLLPDSVSILPVRTSQSRAACDPQERRSLLADRRLIKFGTLG